MQLACAPFGGGPVCNTTEENNEEFMNDPGALVLAMMESIKQVKWQWQQASGSRYDLDELMKMTQDLPPFLDPFLEPDIEVDGEVLHALQRLLRWVERARDLADKLSGMAGLSRLLMGSSVQHKVNYVKDGISKSTQNLHRVMVAHSC